MRPEEISNGCLLENCSSASTIRTIVSRPNSDNTCRQAPQGVPPLLVATAIAVNWRSPWETALKTATFSTYAGRIERRFPH
jgi:hypothetical protein